MMLIYSNILKYMKMPILEPIFFVMRWIPGYCSRELLVKTWATIFDPAFLVMYNSLLSRLTFYEMLTVPW